MRPKQPEHTAPMQTALVSKLLSLCPEGISLRRIAAFLQVDHAHLSKTRYGNQKTPFSAEAEQRVRDALSEREAFFARIIATKPPGGRGRPTGSKVTPQEAERRSNLLHQFMYRWNATQTMVANLTGASNGAVSTWYIRTPGHYMPEYCLEKLLNFNGDKNELLSSIRDGSSSLSYNVMTSLNLTPEQFSEVESYPVNYILGLFDYPQDAVRALLQADQTDEFTQIHENKWRFLQHVINAERCWRDPFVHMSDHQRSEAYWHPRIAAELILGRYLPTHTMNIRLWGACGLSETPVSLLEREALSEYTPIGEPPVEALGEAA